MSKYLVLTFCGIHSLFLTVSAQQGNASKDLASEKRAQSGFINKMDSLFTAKNYSEIINECNKVHPYYNQTQANYNLIAAYYFNGEPEKSFSLLKRKIQDCNTAFSALNILLVDATGYRYFLDEPKVKGRILKSIYQKLEEESISDRKNAKKLLDLYIDDQMTRFMSRMYLSVLSATRFPYPGLLDDSTTVLRKKQIDTDVFNFYKHTGKLFSKEEIGSMATTQLLLFFHEGDLKRREFYLELLKVAVKKDHFPLQREIDFQIATELAKNGDISSFPSPDLVEKYRKLYNTPTYSYFPF